MTVDSFLGMVIKSVKITEHELDSFDLKFVSPNELKIKQEGGEPKKL